MLLSVTKQRLWHTAVRDKPRHSHTAVCDKAKALAYILLSMTKPRNSHTAVCDKGKALACWSQQVSSSS